MNWLLALRLFRYAVALLTASPVGVPLPSAIVLVMIPLTVAAFIGAI
jgi:hypothetical protein